MLHPEPNGINAKRQKPRPSRRPKPTDGHCTPVLYRKLNMLNLPCKTTLQDYKLAAVQYWQCV